VGGYRPGVGVLWSRGERERERDERERESSRERERESRERERERIKEIPGRNYVCGRCRLKSNGVQLNYDDTEHTARTIDPWSTRKHKE